MSFRPRLAWPLLGALLLGAPTLAQEPDLPFHQRQRLVVVFSLSEALQVKSWNGSVKEVLRPGLYRFDAETRSTSVLTPASFQAGSGAFSGYGSSLDGKVRPLLPLLGSPEREATARLKLTSANFGFENVVDAGEVELSFLVALDSSSQTRTRHAGTVQRNGSFVTGDLTSAYTMATSASIQVRHVKLTLEDHLPRVVPLASFPAGLQAEVRPVPASDGAHEIGAGPFRFRLSRGDAVDALGRVSYGNRALFPMVHESDYYGHYRSAPTRGEALVREDGRLYLTFGWALSGRYHGWSYDLVASLTEAERDTLLSQGQVVVQARYDYHYASEDEGVDLSTPCELRLRLSGAPAATPGLSGAVGGH